MELVKFKPNDEHIEHIKEVMEDTLHISPSKDYFSFVTKTDNVALYKIIEDGEIIGGVQCELNNRALHIVLVLEEAYQDKERAIKALELVGDIYKGAVDKAVAYIDPDSKKSFNFFKSLGFKEEERDDEVVKMSYRF